VRGVVTVFAVIVAVVAIFAWSNGGTVTVMFWQWPLVTGSLGLVVIGAGVLGALLAFLGSLPRHARLGARSRELEQRVNVLGGYGADPGSPRPEDTRRLP